MSVVEPQNVNKIDHSMPFACGLCQGTIKIVYVMFKIQIHRHTHTYIYKYIYILTGKIQLCFSGNHIFFLHTKD